MGFKRVWVLPCLYWFKFSQLFWVMLLNSLIFHYTSCNPYNGIITHWEVYFKSDSRIIVICIRLERAVRQTPGISILQACQQTLHSTPKSSWAHVSFFCAIFQGADIFLAKLLMLELYECSICWVFLFFWQQMLKRVPWAIKISFYRIPTSPSVYVLSCWLKYDINYVNLPCHQLWCNRILLQNQLVVN